jgi:hypothetical protein
VATWDAPTTSSRRRAGIGFGGMYKRSDGQGGSGSAVDHTDRRRRSRERRHGRNPLPRPTTGGTPAQQKRIIAEASSRASAGNAPKLLRNSCGTARSCTSTRSAGPTLPAWSKGRGVLLGRCRQRSNHRRHGHRHPPSSARTWLGQRTPLTANSGIPFCPPPPPPTPPHPPPPPSQRYEPACSGAYAENVQQGGESDRKVPRTPDDSAGAGVRDVTLSRKPLIGNSDACGWAGTSARCGICPDLSRVRMAAHGLRRVTTADGVALGGCGSRRPKGRAGV